MKARLEDKNKSGIYKIINNLNKKIYIGRSNNIFARINSHKISSKNIKSPLYNAIRKYNIENFTYEVIEYCDVEEISKKEIYWIEFFNSANRLIGYNLNDSEQGIIIVSKQTRNKISEKLKGNTNSKNKIRTKEHIDKIIESNKRRVWTEEQKYKLRIANLGRKDSKETIEKRNKAITGVKKNLTLEARKILSERLRKIRKKSI